MRYAYQEGPTLVSGVTLPPATYTGARKAHFVIDKGSSGTEFRVMATCESSTDAQAIVDALN